MVSTEIWKELIVREHGYIRWRQNISEKLSADPGKANDNRGFPERFIAMCPTLPKLEDHRPVLDIGDLTELNPGEFVANSGEITGVSGLLRLTDLLSEGTFIQPPTEVLLVGAITPYSLLSTLGWLNLHGWNGAHLTLVDNSPIPIETLRLMGQTEPWRKRVDLVEANILDYTPTIRPDIVIGDILNVWMVDRYQYPHIHKKSPYQTYENFLARMSNIIGNNGIFFSRAMIFPTSTKLNPNTRSHYNPRERAMAVMAELGELAEGINLDQITESIEQMWDNDATRTTYCGLYVPYKYYRSERTLSGPHAKKIMRRLHTRNFGNLREVVVDDPTSGFSFLSFGCRN